jgi:hypothetical protein
LATGVLGHEGGASAASGGDFAAAAAGETAINSVGVDASVPTHAARRQAQAVVASQNFGRRKQTRDMLQRYQHYLPTEISLDPLMIKAPTHPDDDVVTVGKTYAFFFASGTKRAPKIEVCVRHIHMLVSISRSDLLCCFCFHVVVKSHGYSTANSTLFDTVQSATCVFFWCGDLQLWVWFQVLPTDSR